MKLCLVCKAEVPHGAPSLSVPAQQQLPFHKLLLNWPGLQASLEAGQYDLASELLRFLIPPGDNDILAVMPSHAPMHDHSNGKHPQSAANQDVGVSLLHNDLFTVSDPPRL